MLKQFAIIKSKENSLSVGEIIEVMGEEVVPILWVGSEGRYCLLPREVIQNLLELHKGLQQMQGHEQKPTLQLVRDQGVEISNDIGRILAGE